MRTKNDGMALGAALLAASLFAPPSPAAAPEDLQPRRAARRLDPVDFVL